MLTIAGGIVFGPAPAGRSIHPQLDRPGPIMPRAGARVRSVRRSNHPQVLDGLLTDYGTARSARCSRPIPACHRLGCSRRCNAVISIMTGLGCVGAWNVAGREPPKRVPAPEEPARPATSTRAKARIGKRAVVGYFSPELARMLNGMANNRDTTLQVLGEAMDLWLRENGKHPFGERWGSAPRVGFGLCRHFPGLYRRGASQSYP